MIREPQPLVLILAPYESSILVLFRAKLRCTLGIKNSDAATRRSNNFVFLITKCEKLIRSKKEEGQPWVFKNSNPLLPPICPG